MLACAMLNASSCFLIQVNISIASLQCELVDIDILQFWISAISKDVHIYWSMSTINHTYY